MKLIKQRVSSPIKLTENRLVFKALSSGNILKTQPISAFGHKRQSSYCSSQFIKPAKNLPQKRLEIRKIFDAKEIEPRKSIKKVLNVIGKADKAKVRQILVFNKKNTNFSSQTPIENPILKITDNIEFVSVCEKYSVSASNSIKGRKVISIFKQRSEMIDLEDPDDNIFIKSRYY